MASEELLADEIVEEEVTDITSEEEDDTITDEELDRIADLAIEELRAILAHFDAEDAPIDEYEGDNGELILDVVGADLAVLIGRYGKTLDALQQVVSTIVAHKIGYRYPIVVDVEGYKHRRKQKVQQIAMNAASKAVQRNQDVKLRPMSPYERRLVHLALRNDPRVDTISEGEDPNRRVVVKPL